MLSPSLLMLSADYNCASLAPQAMRKQIGKSKKKFVLGRSSRETLVIPNVEHKGLPRLVTYCPKIADCVAAQERLSEPPDFPGHDESMWQGMGNRKRLAVLSAPDGLVDEFVYKRVRVVVKSFQIGTS